MENRDAFLKNLDEQIRKKQIADFRNMPFEDNTFYNEEIELRLELAHYRREAEKILDICYRYRYDPDECVPNDECPAICPKWGGGGQE